MAVSAYDKKHLSEADQKRIQALTDQAAAGKISWESAHNQAESIRSASGYSGGSWGNGYTATSKPEGQTATATSTPKTYLPKASETTYRSTGGGGAVNYTDANGQTDYSVLLQKAMSSGASGSEVQKLLDARTGKALDLGGEYTKYAYDDTYKKAMDYINTAKQQAPQYMTWDDFNQMKSQGGYNAAQEATDAYIKAQIQKTVDGLNAQKGSVSQSAEEAARQAYISYMQSRNALPQALAASGYAGGLADSQRLALDTNLQNNQQEILRNRDNTLNDIDTAVNQARLEGTVQGAQAQAELARDAISAWQNYVNNQNSRINSDFWTKYGYDFQAAQSALDRQQQAAQNDRNFALQGAVYLAQTGDYSGLAKIFGWTPEQTKSAVEQYAYEQGVTRQQAALQLMAQQQSLTGESTKTAADAANALLKAGIMPSAEQLEAMGLTQAQGQALAAYYKGQQTATGETTGRRSSGSGGNTISDVVEDYDGLYAAAAQSPNPQNYIATHYKEHGFSKSSGLWSGYQAWENKQKLSATADAMAEGLRQQFGIEVPGYDRQGMSEANFKGFLQTILTHMRQGNPDQAQAVIQRAVGDLSDEQLQQLDNYLRQNGFSA